MSNKNNIKQHYTRPNLLQEIENNLIAMGKELNSLSPDDLAGLDEFHSRGTYATNELIGLIEASPNMHVLDIGAGIGGAARKLAKATGCLVTCLDITPDFLTTGEALTKYCKLDNLVTHITDDATNMQSLENNSFDAAWTIHASMNIADKDLHYKEASRVLKSKAKFIIYDVFAQTTEPNVIFPVPWADNVDSSFLTTVNKTQDYLQNNGFVIDDIFNKTKETITFFQKILDKTKQPNKQPSHLLMKENYITKIENLLNNLINNQLSVQAIICSKI